MSRHLFLFYIIATVFCGKLERARDCARKPRHASLMVLQACRAWSGVELADADAFVQFLTVVFVGNWRERVIVRESHATRR
jgi:transposase